MPTAQATESIEDGYYNGGGSNVPAYSRFNGSQSNTRNDIGLRVALYL